MIKCCHKAVAPSAIFSWTGNSTSSKVPKKVFKVVSMATGANLLIFCLLIFYNDTVLAKWLHLRLSTCTGNSTSSQLFSKPKAVAHVDVARFPRYLQHVTKVKFDECSAINIVLAILLQNLPVATRVTFLTWSHCNFFPLTLADLISELFYFPNIFFLTILPIALSLHNLPWWTLH